MKILTYIIAGFLIGINLLNAQNQVAIPDTLSGTQFDLSLQSGTVQFYPGQISNTMGINGNILGPTLIMNKGDMVNILVDNQLSETTTIHWHGMHVSASNDGGPHTTIEPSEVWNPSFTVFDRAATYWYHPHLHEKTNEHVSKGIAGFIIVRDEDEAALDLPRTYGVDDFPLVIQTKDFDENNQIVTPSNADDVLMVNATIDPMLDVPAQVVRFRLLNGSSQRVFNLGLSGNQTFYQIGSDDGLLSETNAVSRLRLAPGERVEVLIDLTAMQGQSLSLMSFAAELANGIYGASNPGIMPIMILNGYNPNPLNGTNFTILEMNVVATTNNPVMSIPGELVEVNPIPESLADITRTLIFTPEQAGPNSLNGKFYINGTSFDMDIINYSIAINNIEIWTITNQSPIAHPFHIHDVHFYVLDRNGNPPPPGEQGRKDVILVPAMETVRFITQFTDFANDEVPYMYHCHMLTHEDDGMMGQFEVVDNPSGIAQGIKDRNNIKIYPNPVSGDEVKVLIPGKVKNVEYYELYTATGNMIIHKPLGSIQQEILLDLSNVKPGTYILIVKTSNEVYTESIIKK
ncbi:MAG: bilirubin oxidase [Bacteroidetes bacterium]|nr:MAG: bilirubin oxidase [Bacteroidota bacterium]